MEEPAAYLADDAGVVSRSSRELVENALSRLRASSGCTVRIVVTRTLPPDTPAPADYARQLFADYGGGDKDVVVVLGTKIARGGVYAGEQARRLLTDEIGTSIGEETFPQRARVERYGGAVLDVSNRLVPVLSGKADPGPPVVKVADESSRYKTKEETDKERKKYTGVVLILLVVSVVAPMLQYFWYTGGR